MYDSLEKFKILVEIGNFTIASEKLGITQPALSMSIKTLEEGLGSKLLIRSRQGISLTEIGQIVYKYSLGFANDMKSLRNEIDEKLNNSKLTLSLGMIDNIADLFVNKVFSAYQDLNLQLEVNSTQNLISYVESGKLDVAIVTRPQKNLNSSIVIKNFGIERLVVVANPKTAKNKFTDINFVSYNKDSNTHNLILSSLNKFGVSPNFVAYSSNPGFLIQMVLSSNLATILPENYVQNLINQKKLINIRKGITIERELVIIKTKHSFISKRSYDLIKHLSIEFNKNKK